MAKQEPNKAPKITPDNPVRCGRCNRLCTSDYGFKSHICYSLTNKVPEGKGRPIPVQIVEGPPLVNKRYI